MKMYRSLVYRELKLTRKRFILMLILFILVALLMLLPVFIGGMSEAPEMADDLQGLLFFASGVVALTGGFMAGTNNGLQKADISSGWKRYSFVLPPTAKQQAMSDLLVKLCYILFFGLLSTAFAMIYTIAADHNAFALTLNIYLGAVCAVMLIDVAYSYIVMFARDRNQLKIFGVVAFFGAGIILKAVGLFADIKKSDKPAEGGDMISEEALDRFLTPYSSL